jgi:hypothetical protein
MAALDDPDPGNPIAVEVARLIEGYTENFRAHVERLGYIPDSFLRAKPQTAIEAVAMRLTTEAIQMNSPRTSTPRRAVNNENSGTLTARSQRVGAATFSVDIRNVTHYGFE